MRLVRSAPDQPRMPASEFPVYARTLWQTLKSDYLTAATHIHRVQQTVFSPGRVDLATVHRVRADTRAAIDHLNQVHAACDDILAAAETVDTESP